MNLEKLRAALLGRPPVGSPGGSTPSPGEPVRRGPGFAVATYWHEPKGRLYDVVDGDGGTVGTFESQDVAEAIAELCNEAT